MGFNSDIVYKKGVENKVVDALSRIHESEGQLFLVSWVTPLWQQEIINNYEKDTLAQKLLTQLIVDPQSAPPYTLVHGLLKHYD